MSPFDILNKDFDDFALIVNYFLENQEEEPEQTEKPKAKSSDKEKRIKVNDKTASGGWF